MAHKGKFRPKNPAKYHGDPTNIIYRSGWELKYMAHLDSAKDVISWSSEEVIIRYKSPKDGKYHRYFPDFWVKRKVGNVTEEILIEIKPSKQTLPPKKPPKVTRRYFSEVMTWGINKAKWDAAEVYCESRQWKFLIYTEKELQIT